MAIIKLSVSSIGKLGLWDKVCEYKGWNNWIRKDLGEDAIVAFDDGFEKEEDRGKCINRAKMEGIVTLRNGDSPNDFDELFQNFIDKYEWHWKGNIEWH
jgi:hypothetical protein